MHSHGISNGNQGKLGIAIKLPFQWESEKNRCVYIVQLFKTVTSSELLETLSILKSIEIYLYNRKDLYAHVLRR